MTTKNELDYVTSESQERETLEKTKDAIANAQESAKQGVDDIKEKGQNIASEIKTGFSPDAGTTGIKGFVSRIQNLWKSSKIRPRNQNV